MFPWISFLTYATIMAITPGPNNIMCMNNAKNVGFRKGAVFNYGIFAGIFTVQLLCLLFSSALFSLVPAIELPMKIAGSAYMLFLALKPFLPAREHAVKAARGTFLAGALLQLVNPKLIIYTITGISAFVLPYYRALPALCAFAFFLALLGLIATLCWAAFGSLFSKLFTKHKTLLNIIMALMLVYCVITLFL